jgi:DNA sulfur modification protein DndE
MRIKRSRKQDELIEKLTNLYGFNTDSAITRVAFSMSLSSEKKFQSDDDSIASDGKEFRDARALFGTSQSGKSYFAIFKALLDQKYLKQTSEDEFISLFKLHLSHGLEELMDAISKAEIVKGEHLTFIANLVQEKLNLLDNTDTPSNNATKPVNSLQYPEYTGLVNFTIGENENGEDLEIRLNDLDEFDSHHISIAGMTGSGKTQLLKDILYQISSNTDNSLKYIFFDYKGEGNKKELEKFLSNTDGEFIDMLSDEFNFNPLEFISLDNKRNQVFEIQSFIDSIQAIDERISVKQTHYLKDVMTNLLMNRTEHPEIKDISDSLREYYDENGLKPDTLLSIIDNLSSGLFNRDKTDKSPIFNKSLYLNLPITIADTIRQLSVFLILKYLLAEFSKAEDTRPQEENSQIKPLRYIIVIDEAHVYLKHKKARKILEDLLRVIRSKGVVIILLTQGVEDFKQKDFDFASQVKVPICLNIKDKNIKSLTNFLGSATSKNKFEKAVKGLENGKAIVNFKEPELINIKQFWKTAKNL